MRYYEIACGLRVPVSSEERELLDKVEHDEPASQDDMTERQQEVARLMVSRGVLRRDRNNGKICFIANSCRDIWRDPHDS